MMKNEFEELVHTTLTQKEYDIIEKVYVLSPYFRYKRKSPN